MASACAIARQKLVSYVDNLKPGGGSSATGSVIKAAYIGGISAPLKGVVGNTAWGGFRTLVAQPAEAAVDYVLSFGRSASTGFDIKPHEFRTVVSALSADGLQAYGKGFGRGVKTVTTAVKAGKDAASGLQPGTPFAARAAAFADEVNAHMTADANRLTMDTPRSTVQIKSNGGRAFVSGAFALVEAVDRPAFEGSYDASLYMQAKLASVRAGRGTDKAFIKTVLDAPTDEMLLRALDDAMYNTFKDKPIIAAGVENTRSFLRRIADDPTHKGQLVGQVSAALMDIMVPFTGVPSSIVAKATSLTPLGFAGVANVKKSGQQGVARSIANASLGTGLVAAGAAMASAGLLTGTPSNSKNERSDNQFTRKDYAIKLGGQWMDIRTLGPFAIPLFVGADLMRKREKDPDASPLDMLGTGVATIGRSAVENSFAQGIKKTIDAVQDPDRDGPGALAGLVPIPSLVGQVSRAMDPKEREAQSVTERLAARTPARMLLPEKLTLGGATPEKGLGERLAPFSPLQTKPDRDTPELAEIRRLGLAIGMPERTTSINRKRVDIPYDTYKRQVEALSARALPAVQRVMASPAYASLPDEEKKRRINITINRSRDFARKTVRGDVQKLLPQ